MTTMYVLQPTPNIPAMPPLSFQGIGDESAQKRMLSPAFATHTTSTPGSADTATTARPGTPVSSIPTSPGILFGSFDQWDNASKESSATTADTPLTVEAPQDVRYAALALASSTTARRPYADICAPVLDIVWWQWRRWSATVEHTW